MPARPRGSTALANALSQILTPIAEAAGFDLEAITVTAAGRRSVVRVVVDADDADLESIAVLSRAINAALDEDAATDLIDGAYQLEVSSPGVDRPLTEPRHWRRAAGRLVVVAIDGMDVTGRVVSADEDGVQLSIGGDVRTVAWAGLGVGRVQVEFNRDSVNNSDSGQSGDPVPEQIGEG